MDDPTLLSWIERGQNIAALLVAIGVAGEFALGFMAGPARRRVDAAREAEIVRLTTESAKASERAAGVEQDNIRLKIALETLKRNSRRYLTREEQDQLVRSLPQNAFSRVLIVCPAGNVEAARFGDDFAAVFKRLHWNPDRWFPSVTGNTMDRQGPVPPGITIGVPDPYHPPQAALELKSILEHLDFPFSSKIGQNSVPSPGNPKYVQLDLMIGEN